MPELKTEWAMSQGPPDAAGGAWRRFWQRPTRLTRYGIAIVLVLLAFALRWAIFGYLDQRLPFTFFLFAVMVAAWYGGLGPGLLAAVAGLLLGDYFFLPEHGAYAALSDAARTAITLFAINSTLIVVLMEALHTRIRRLEAALEKKVAGDQPASK
jgi:K+-sensing histidine kinase KdpD